MPEPREARSIIESAEQAAAAGNYASAEDLLREAATLQEHTLGPQHPDLANTLNNLGVVCEITDNPIDAEHYFRRAYAIATAALPPDHPFVATSRKNLHDFCATRGRPVDLPPSPPAVAAWLEAPAPAAPRRQPAPPPKSEDVEPIPQTRSLRPLTIGVLTSVGLLIVMLAVSRTWSSRSEETTPPRAAAVTPPREGKTAQPILPPAGTTAPRQPPASSAQATRSEAASSAARPDMSAPSAGTPTVVRAELCTALTNWRCETAGSEVAPGQTFFYTQVKSAAATTIEHRWYQGERLHRAVQLRIEANPGAGYRTFSRNTISAEGAGDWRVELRSADGTVLHEARFAVREPVR